MDAKSIKRRERLKQQVIKNTEDDFNHWLQLNVLFEHGRELVDGEAVRRAHTILELLLKEKRQRRRDWKKKQVDVEILCANLLVNGRRKPVAISLDRKSYVPNRYTRASYFTTTLVHLMEENGWIEYKIGYKSLKQSRMSRIWPTKTLLEYFKLIDLVDFRPVELVNLRDEKHHNVFYEDTPETNKIREILRKANIVNREAQVQLKVSRGFVRLNTDLYAVFNNSSWNLGGRLYTCKDGYQSLAKEDRPHICINHEQTVELDYSAMQPRLLYAMEKIPYPLDADPYTDVISDFPELRPFSKQLLLALLNAKSLDKAIASGNYNIHKDFELYQTIKTIGTTAAELVKRFKKAHPEIAKYFGTAIGLELMRQDARIALEVVKQFTSRDIPLLAIHDSFIVQKRWEDELRKVMTAAFKKYSGGFECPIK